MTPYPPNTPALPYKCDDPRCPCHMTLEMRPYEEGVSARPHENHAGWSAAIVVDETGFILDEYYGYPTLTELLQAVHRDRPDAEFNPETAP